MLLTRDDIIKSMEHSKKLEIKECDKEKFEDLLREKNKQGWNIANEIAITSPKRAVLNLLSLLNNLPLFQDIILNRTSTGTNLLMNIARYQDLNTLKAFLDTVLQKVPDSFAELTTAQSDAQWHIGHFIAYFQNVTTLQYFLDLVLKKDSDSFTELVTAKTREQWHLGHVIACYQDSQTLRYFLDLILQNKPEAFTEVATAKNNEQSHLGHIIARYKDSQTLRYFLDLILQSKSESFTEVVTAKNNEQSHLGHVIARYKDSQTLRYFLDLILQSKPESFTEVVTAKNKLYNHMGHLLAEFQTDRHVVVFIERVAKHAPLHLQEVLTAKNYNNQSLFEIIKSKHPSVLGQVIFECLQCNQRLDDALSDQFKPYKRNVLNYVRTLDSETQLKVLAECLNKKTEPGRFFNINHSSICFRFFKDPFYKEIEIMRTNATEDTKKQSVYQQQRPGTFLLPNLQNKETQPSTRIGITYYPQ